MEQPVREGYQGRYKNKAGIYVREAEDRETELIREGKLKEIKKEFAVR